MLTQRALERQIQFFLEEDELSKNFAYLSSLPDSPVRCRLKFKDDLMICGLPFFIEVFNYVSDKKLDSKILKNEGRVVSKKDAFEIEFESSFHIALSVERLALNLLQKASSIATHTKKFQGLCEGFILLDTRKTTPGLRFLEKYATQLAGAKNHRFSQTDLWMIKDNHKSFFGGVKEAIQFFKNQNGFYTPIVLEVHSLDEIELGATEGIKHFMLDNFSVDMILKAVQLKPSGATYEVSGGITEDNIKDYLIEGVDAFSAGSLTYGARPVDISLKFERFS